MPACGDCCFAVLVVYRDYFGVIDCIVDCGLVGLPCLSGVFGVALLAGFCCLFGLVLAVGVSSV